MLFLYRTSSTHLLQFTYLFIMEQRCVVITGPGKVYPFNWGANSVQLLVPFFCYCQQVCTFHCRLRCLRWFLDGPGKDHPLLLVRGNCTTPYLYTIVVYYFMYPFALHLTAHADGSEFYSPAPPRIVTVAMSGSSITPLWIVLRPNWKSSSFSESTSCTDVTFRHWRDSVGVKVRSSETGRKSAGAVDTKIPFTS